MEIKQHYLLFCVAVARMTPLLLLLAAQALLAQEAPTPVVLWHGMGDSAAGMIGIAVSAKQ